MKKSLASKFEFQQQEHIQQEQQIQHIVRTTKTTTGIVG